MEVIQRVRVACPRCGTAVIGDFKFCPTCAYRLKPGATPEIEKTRSRNLASVVLAVAATLFVGLLAGIGVWVFRDAKPSRIETPVKAFAPALPPEGLTVETFRKYLRRVPAGIAYYFQEDLEEGEAEPDVEPPWVPMHVGDLDVLIYEVTRSLYAEFLVGLKARLDAGEAPPPTLAAIWSARTVAENTSAVEKANAAADQAKADAEKAVTDAEKAKAAAAGARAEAEKEQAEAESAKTAYARNYLHRWLYRFLTYQFEDQKLAPEELETLPEYVLALLPEHARKEMVRIENERGLLPFDAFVQAMPFPWPKNLRLLLLAPPLWTRVNQWSEIVAEVPHDTGTLPVTEIAWTDARAFAEWLTQRLGGTVRLRLPIEGEWRRIAHGNHPGGGPYDATAWDFPWGKSMLRHACNNAEIYRHTGNPVLQPVGQPYRDVDAKGVHDGTTVDGIFDMAGNAREWVLRESAEAQRVNGVYRVWYDAEQDAQVESAPTQGGSYLQDLPDCRVRVVQHPEKYVRHIGVGFRLVAEPVL